jgi:hypothetical protein
VTPLRDYPFALLRTSRQIYAETALLPFQLNLSECDETWHLAELMAHRLDAQREVVTAIEVSSGASYGIDAKDEWKSINLPSLKKINIWWHGYYDFEADNNPDMEALQIELEQRWPHAEILIERSGL